MAGGGAAVEGGRSLLCMICLREGGGEETEISFVTFNCTILAILSFEYTTYIRKPLVQH